MIMSPTTVANIFLGSILGWGILSPLAKKRGWAPGPVGNWDTGSQGWIIWVSLAATLGDSIVTVGWFSIKSSRSLFRQAEPPSDNHQRTATAPFNSTLPAHSKLAFNRSGRDHNPLDSETTPLLRRYVSDTPSSRQASKTGSIETRTLAIWLLSAVTLCVFSTQFVFGAMLPIYATIIAVIITYPLSFVTTYGLGETDYSMASKISSYYPRIQGLVSY